MDITPFFKSLNAPLKNPNWSWGAFREADRTVFLCVWQDRAQTLTEGRFMQITHQAIYEGVTDNYGNNERLKHIELIRSGAKAYMVMQEAKDREAHPRERKSFNERELFPGGRLIQHEGDYWLEILPRVEARTVRCPSP